MTAAVCCVCGNGCGIGAIAYDEQANTAIATGDYTLARQRQQKACLCRILSVFFGIVLGVPFLLWLYMAIVFAAATGDNWDRDGVSAISVIWGIIGCFLGGIVLCTVAAFFVRDHYRMRDGVDQRP